MNGMQMNEPYWMKNQKWSGQTFSGQLGWPV